MIPAQVDGWTFLLSLQVQKEESPHCTESFAFDLLLLVLTVYYYGEKKLNALVVNLSIMAFHLSVCSFSPLPWVPPVQICKDRYLTMDPSAPQQGVFSYWCTCAWRWKAFKLKKVTWDSSSWCGWNPPWPWCRSSYSIKYWVMSIKTLMLYLYLH